MRRAGKGSTKAIQSVWKNHLSTEKPSLYETYSLRSQDSSQEAVHSGCGLGYFELMGCLLLPSKSAHFYLAVVIRYLFREGKKIYPHFE